MNYLAHALLSGSQPAARLGGMLGDFVKGPLDSLQRQYPAEVVAGIALHRRIDGYTDAHAAFRRSRQRVSSPRRRFSGVMVDMFYDHFLARHWSDFCAQPLDAFTAETYALLSRNLALLPPRLADVVPRMRASDWLGSYREIEAIGIALDRIAASRLRQENTLAGAVEELLAEYEGYEADFRAFFVDALSHFDLKPECGVDQTEKPLI